MSVHNVQTISCFCAVLHLVPFTHTLSSNNASTPWDGFVWEQDGNRHGQRHYDGEDAKVFATYDLAIVDTTHNRGLTYKSEQSSSAIKDDNTNKEIKSEFSEISQGVICRK